MTNYSFSAAPVKKLFSPVEHTDAKDTKISAAHNEERDAALTLLHLKNAGYQLVQSYFCPGRVNLIGEHMDYNGGESLPFAIDLGIQFEVFAKETASASCPDIWIGSLGQRLVTKGSPETHAQKIFETLHDSRCLESPVIRGQEYIIGAWNVLEDQVRLQFSQSENKVNNNLPRQHNFVILISGNLPSGAGLSSSAAFTIGLLQCFAWLRKMSLTSEETALLAQRVEHKYAHTPCGLMDQIAILETPPDGLLAAHFNEINENGFPRLEGLSFGKIQEHYAVGIFHSGRSHQLSDGSYQSRQDECKHALHSLCIHWQKELAEITNQSCRESVTQKCSTLGSLYRFLKDEVGLAHENILNKSCEFLTDSTATKRVYFVFEEMRRVEEMKTALEQANFNMVHFLLTDAQAGLSKFYEVSCPEIETAEKLFLSLYQKDRQTKYCNSELPLFLGPRMMGGGFGGSLILFVLKSRKSEFDLLVKQAISEYETLTHCKAKFYSVKPCAGIKFGNPPASF